MSWETVRSILEYSKALCNAKQDCVVIGSTAMVLHGIYTGKPNDLDIVVLNLDELKGDLYPYYTNSRHSISGKRACILENGITKIDIFVEDFLPEYEIIDGIRVITIQNMLFYYKNLLPKVAEHWRKDILHKINVLEHGK